MENICTCKELDCELHPTNHKNGCTPCIKENLKTKDIPNCMLYEIDPSDIRENDSFELFAKLLKDSKK